MSIIDKLGLIDELQRSINSFAGISDSIAKKINYKFRLEWNYTSNSMEGNTLTKDETRSVMIGNITVDGKPIKDILEMKGHDEVINTILKVGRGELNLSEKRIKDIHLGIMHEEDPDKKAMIGQWKKSQNYLYNYKNERFDFVSPSDVPDRMHQLINWLNAEKEKIQRKSQDALHPVILALKFNLDYITIHPFYDGNGRTSRILTNLILISYGYPPLYIKENERSGYYQYLGDIQGYGGAPDVFYDYMAGLIMRSQKLVLDAIEGKDIDGADDWEKKLQMLKATTDDPDNSKQYKSSDSLKEIITVGILPLIEKLINKMSAYEELFAERQIIFFTNGRMHRVIEMKDIERIYKLYPNSFSNNVKFLYELIGFKRNGNRPFDCHAVIDWEFNAVFYSCIINSDDEKKIKHYYGEQYTGDEANYVVNVCGQDLFRQIERGIENK